MKKKFIFVHYKDTNFFLYMQVFIDFIHYFCYIYNMEKICSKCKHSKILSEFYIDKSAKCGFVSFCKECGVNSRKQNKEKIKERNIKYAKNNPQTIKLSQKKSRVKNKEKLKKYGKEYREKLENKIKKSKANKKRYYENPKKESERKKKYRKDNPEKIKELDKIKNKKFSNSNPHIIAWRSVLKSSLNRLGKPKEGHTIELLGYSALDLKNHMISLFTDGMSWDNHGEWHIDHIKRVSEFDKDTAIDIVNALSNLRPLWGTSRIVSGVFYEGNLNRG